MKTTPTSTPPIVEPRPFRDPKSLAKGPEVMEFLGIGTSQLYRFVQRGLLPQPLKFGTAQNAGSRWKWGDVYRCVEKLENIN